MSALKRVSDNAACPEGREADAGASALVLQPGKRALLIRSSSYNPTFPAGLAWLSLERRT